MTAESEQQQLSAYISTADIAITGFNPRKDFDEDGLNELASSIGHYGILEPLVVRKARGGTYELVAGERRLKAAQKVGLDQVPVVVRDFSDEQVREVMLLENLQRKDLRPLEEASALSILIELGISREDLADRIGMSYSWVAARIRLLKLPEKIQQYLQEGKLGVEQAMAYVPYTDWPVIDAMVKDLEEKFDTHRQYRPIEDLSVTDVKHMIDLELCNGKNSQDIDFFGWGESAKDFKKEFHLDGECKDCKVPIEYGNIQRLCLDAKCFRKKMREAKKRIKAQEEKATDKLEKSGKVELSKLGYGKYKELRKSGWDGAKFDLRECNSCEHRKVGLDNWAKEHTVCMNPRCWEEKTKQVEQAKERHARELQALLRSNMKKILDDDIEDLERRLFRLLLERAFDAEDQWDREAIKPWVKKKPKKGWRVALDEIPEEDVPKAILLIASNDIAFKLGLRNDFSDNDLKRAFPELFEGELPPNVDALLAGDVDLCHRLDMPGPCIGEDCASWDSVTGECTDDVKAELEAIEESDDPGACEKRGGEAEGEFCDPGAFPECSDCEVYGAIEE